MGHIAFAAMRPQDRRVLSEAAKTFQELGETVESQAGTLPEVAEPARETLYEKVLGAEHWDETLHDRTGGAHEVVIVSDTIVRVGGRNKRLDREYIFVLNQLLMDLRPFTSQALRKIVQTPEGNELTPQQLRGIVSGLHLLLGEEAMVLTFAGTHYVCQLHPEVTVTDGRPASEAATVMVLDTKLVTPPGVVEADGDYFRSPGSLGNSTHNPELEQVFEIGPDPQEVGPGGYSWGSLNDIARFSGLSAETARRFVIRHRAKIGKRFPHSEMRRDAYAANGDELTEYFPPEFIAWTVQSLRFMRWKYLSEQRFIRREL